MTQLNYSCDAIIVNYNAGKLLSGCVASVFSQGITHAIVVDNASADDSMACLADMQVAELTFICNARNLGFSAACNMGFMASSSPYLLFLNPDCTLEAGALGRLIEVLENAPDVGMVGGLLCNLDGSEQPGGRRVFPTPRRAFMRAFGLSRFASIFPRLFSDFLLHQQPLPSAPIEVEAISGACMLVRREAVDDVGLWDEGYFLHCEDLDWCMRFRQKGWKILFVPGAKITHALGVCGRSRPIFVEWHKHKGMMRFYHKFFRHQYPGILMAVVALGVWLRFAAVAGYYSVRHLREWPRE